MEEEGAAIERMLHAQPIECPLISNAVVGAASYGTYISLCEKVANKRQRRRPVVISPPLSSPRALPLSESVCR